MILKPPQKTGLPAAAENFQVEAQFLGPFWEHLKWCRRNRCRGDGWDGNVEIVISFHMWPLNFKCRLWWMIYDSQQMHGCRFRDFSFFLKMHWLNGRFFSLIKAKDMKDDDGILINIFFLAICQHVVYTDLVYFSCQLFPWCLPLQLSLHTWFHVSI